MGSIPDEISSPDQRQTGLAIIEDRRLPHGKLTLEDCKWKEYSAMKRIVEAIREEKNIKHQTIKENEEKEEINTNTLQPKCLIKVSRM